MSHFYITTTLPYVNAHPHIGHALEFVQADVIARRQRQRGKDVVFNVGTDEHGLKIFEKAQEANMDIQDFVDKNVDTFKDFCKIFDITYDNFYRTSDPSHYTVAQAFRKKAQANDDIYEKKYTGLYCVGCESFKTPKELVDGKCPDHNKEPIPYEEENYFFKLSKQKEQLLEHIDNHKDFILPRHKSEELRNFVKDMEDISVSRKKENLPWGVPVPNDDNQVMYVRFDALTNYVGAVGFPNDDSKLTAYRGTEKTDNKAVQICGPDNLRFQGAIRQGMLASAQLPFTKHILVHGMIMGPDGNKMSKTLGNVISPLDQYEKYGVEAVRYYLIAGIQTFGDGAYKPEDLINMYNSHLANSFGNLLNRVIHLANKKEIKLDPSHQIVEQDSKERVNHSKSIATHYYDEYKLYEAASVIHKLAMTANTYMDEKKPRDKTLSKEDIAITLHTLHYYIDTIISLYNPIIPQSCQKAKDMLKNQEKGILFEKIETN